MTAKAPTTQPKGVVRPPAPKGPPNKWNFEDAKIDNHEGDYQWDEKSERLVRMYTQAEVDDAIAKIIRQHMKTIDEYRKEILDLQDKVASLDEHINDMTYEQSMRDFYEN